ncbi:MAG TPA: DNA topoisomerase IB [Roseiarcus sp.]|nr:DNA topoisomerase IB [Roseiarcus sp.]
MLDSGVGAFSVDVGLPAASLRYVRDSGPAIRRRRAGKGFFYLDARGRRITDPDVLKRIRSIVIPPAWTDVWICPDAEGHVQATGRDAKGRKQYRYHAHYREAQEEAKFDHLLQFAEALPTIRATVTEHMSLRGLPREKILATVVYLLEATLIRVGNEEYAKANQSYGLTTLKGEHVEVDGTEIRFQFTGKSGRQWSLAVRDRRVAKIIRTCQELPGQDLLQYFDEDKQLRSVSSGDVNDYLRTIAGYGVTAKDFRTWAGTVLMTRFLKEAGPFNTLKQAKRSLRDAIGRVAAALGNTSAVCRKSYIHPAVISAHLDGALVREGVVKAGASAGARARALRAEEAAALALLCG